jgi:RNA polymerase sigma-70 factor, ECF subfamily
MTLSPRQVDAMLAGRETADLETASRLLPVVYTELRRLAHRYLRREKPGQSLQPTELVHEAYQRLADKRDFAWKGKSHFLAIAAIAMRHILVDRARARLAERRGGGAKLVSLDEAFCFSPEKSDELIALDDALHQLAALSPRQSRTVELRFFGGLDMEEIAELEGVSARTVKRDWALARAWLHREIARNG